MAIDIRKAMAQLQEIFRDNAAVPGLTAALRSRVERDVAATLDYFQKAASPDAIAKAAKYENLTDDQRAENMKQYVLDLADHNNLRGNLNKYTEKDDPHLANLLTTESVVPAKPRSAPPTPALVTEDKLWAAVQKMKSSRNANAQSAALMLEEIGEAGAKSLLVAAREGVIKAKEMGETELPIVLSVGEEKAAIRSEHWSGNRRSFLRKAGRDLAGAVAVAAPATLIVGGIGQLIENSYASSADRARRDASYVPPKGVEGPREPAKGQKLDTVNDLEDNPFGARNDKGVLVAQDPARQQRHKDAEADEQGAKTANKYKKGAMATTAGLGVIYVAYQIPSKGIRMIKKWWDTPKELAPESGRNLGKGIALILEEAGLKTTGVNLSVERGGPEASRTV